MGHFGFSYIGLLFLLMLFVPNLLWTQHQPEGYQELAKEEPKVLLAFERIGQVLTTSCALCFADFDLHGLTPWSIWLAAAFLLMVLYEICWVRYFTQKPTLSAFYGSFLGIPVPLATLPVAAFFLLGVYGKVIWLMAAAVILGIGHMGIHLGHYKTIRRKGALHDQ